MQFDSPDRVAQVFECGPVRPCRPPSTEQPRDDRQEEIPAAKRRFQKTFFMERLIFRVANKVEDEIDNLSAGKDGSPGTGIRAQRQNLCRRLCLAARSGWIGQPESQLERLQRGPL